MLILSACSIPSMNSFNYFNVDNGENNYLAGGNFAFKDNTLYVTSVSDLSQTSKTYAINNKGTTLLNETKSVNDYIKNTPVFYQTKSNLYICTDDWYKVNTKDNSLSKSISDDIKQITEADYYSDNLVIQSIDYGQEFKVTYQKEKTYRVKHEYQNLCYGNNKVYFVDFDNAIYCNSPAQGKGDCKYLTDTSADYHQHLGACGGLIYYDAIGETNAQSASKRTDSGLYCFSEKTKTHKLLIQGEINSLNSFKEVMYIASENGIYKCKKDKPIKLCDKKADEVYIMDNTWVYCLNNSNGEVFRVSQNGNKIELIL